MGPAYNEQMNLQNKKSFKSSRMRTATFPVGRGGLPNSSRCRLPSPVCRQPPPLLVDRQTPMKTLRCPKRLRAVNVLVRTGTRYNLIVSPLMSFT